jgi:hypothetical protein
MMKFAAAVISHRGSDAGDGLLDRLRRTETYPPPAAFSFSAIKRRGGSFNEE